MSELEEQTTAQQERHKLRFGLTIGVDEVGQFVVEMHGENPSTVELLGCATLAQRQMQIFVDKQLGQGDHYLATGINEVIKRIDALGREPETKE